MYKRHYLILFSFIVLIFFNASSFINLKPVDTFCRFIEGSTHVNHVPYNSSNFRQNKLPVTNRFKIRIKALNDYSSMCEPEIWHLRQIPTNPKKTEFPLYDIELNSFSFGSNLLRGPPFFVA
jgi:hypothetical protein